MATAISLPPAKSLYIAKSPAKPPVKSPAKPLYIAKSLYITKSPAKPISLAESLALYNAKSPAKPPSFVPSVTPLSLVPLFTENNPIPSQSPVGIFEEARDKVIGEIDSIVESLNGKRAELLAKIGSLEREFLDRQREKQNDINKLNTLISHTEELGQNTLLDLQQKVIREMRQEMDKLKLDGKQEPNYRIGIKWGFTKAVLIQSINCSDVELITDAAADCLVLSDATDSSEDNTGLAIQPDSSPDSEGGSPVAVPFTSKSRTPQELVDTPRAREGRSILYPFLHRRRDRNVIKEPVSERMRIQLTERAPDRVLHVRAAVEESRERDYRQHKPGSKKSRWDTDNLWD